MERLQRMTYTKLSTMKTNFRREKYVKIDDRTTIVVSVNVSDKKARSNYLEKVKVSSLKNEPAHFPTSRRNKRL